MIKSGETIDCSFLQKYSIVSLGSHQIVRQKSDEGGSPLPKTFQPSKYEVICGRGKTCYDHPGNVMFRETVSMHLKEYLKAKTKLEKSLVVVAIVDSIRESSSNGGFVKKNYTTDAWEVVSDRQAREKVGHSLRETLKAAKSLSRNDKRVPPQRSFEKKQKSLLLAQREIFRKLVEADTQGEI